MCASIYIPKRNKRHISPSIFSNWITKCTRSSVDINLSLSQQSHSQFSCILTLMKDAQWLQRKTKLERHHYSAALFLFWFVPNLYFRSNRHITNVSLKSPAALVHPGERIKRKKVLPFIASTPQKHLRMKFHSRFRSNKTYHEHSTRSRTRRWIRTLLFDESLFLSMRKT